MADFTTETLFNDLSRMYVVDDTATIPALTGVTATGSTTGGTLAAATYYYKVTALTPQGETTGSNEVNATTTGSTSSVTITYPTVAAATGYKIYKGTAAGTETSYFTDNLSPFVDTGVAGTAGTVPTTNTAIILTDPGVPAGQKALVIQRLDKFLSGSTTSLYRRLATSAVNEIAQIAFPNQTYAAGVYRLVLSVLSLGSYPADYNRWAINKGKPFYIEVNLAAAVTGGDNMINAILPSLIRGLKKANGQVIQDVAFTATTATGIGTLIITAHNEYLRFIDVELQEYLVDPYNSTNFYFQPFLVGGTTTPGVEGFGTSWFLTKNFRIPTTEAIRFMGEDQDERPVIGVLYNQYTLTYVTNRNIGSQDFVGGRGITTTTHVMFIPQTLASTFEGYVSSAFGSTFMLTV